MGGRRATGRSDATRSKGAATPAKDRATRTRTAGDARTRAAVPPALPRRDSAAKRASAAPAKPKATAKSTAPTKARADAPESKKAGARAPAAKPTTPKAQAAAKPATVAKAPSAGKPAAKRATAPAPKKSATSAKTAPTAKGRATSRASTKSTRSGTNATPARLDDAASLVPANAPRGASAPLAPPEPPAPAIDAPIAVTAHPDDAPSVPKGPYADHTTDELWVLYRAEVQRLRAVDAAAAGTALELETEEELDEEAELRRLEAAALAEAAREAALLRGEQPSETPDEPEPPEAQRAPARRGAHSPELERLRNELIERHYPLVRYIAERLLQTLPKSIELDDLISAGQFGLMDAIRGFDPSRGIKFKTYCSTRIRGSILDQLRSQDWVPRLVRLKATRIDKALQRLTGEYGREPTHAELARALELEHGELSREIMESQARTMFSLSEKWDDDDEGAVEKVEILEDRTAIDPVHELNRRDLMVFMTRSLTHKERFIIEQYYQYGHTMREIGEMLTLTESRVCQIHSNVMARLKSLLAQRGDALSG